MTALTLATRTELPERAVIGIIDNRKALAKELLTILASEIGERLQREVEIVLHSKPGPSLPIPDDEALQFAARCHVVISGLGD